MQHSLNSALRCLFLFTWLLLALPGQSQASGKSILVFGDSISAAYGMSLEQGWVAQLARELEEQASSYSVVNASISGETTAGGLRRLPAVLQEHQPAIVLLELGANDGLRGYPLKTMAQNLAEMVTMAQESGAKVILLPMQIPPNYGARYTTGFYDTYQQVAEQTDSVLAPFILEHVALDPTLVQPDGIHPTVAAQPKMLETVLPTILKELPEQ